MLLMSTRSKTTFGTEFFLENDLDRVLIFFSTERLALRLGVRDEVLLDFGVTFCFESLTGVGEPTSFRDLLVNMLTLKSKIYFSNTYVVKKCLSA